MDLTLCLIGHVCDMYFYGIVNSLILRLPLRNELVLGSVKTSLRYPRPSSVLYIPW